MNLVDCVVEKVLSLPSYHEYSGVNWWTVRVRYNSWGTTSDMDLICPTFEQAYAVTEGYKFLA
jgi:hypothetical protein